MSRIENTKRNMLFSLASMLFTTGLTFVNRTVFIYTLGLNYLGLNGLYTNILSFLAIAELGVGNAISFSLYKPLADGDERKMVSYLNLFRKCYFIIGSVILVIGLSLVPFLDVFVNFDETVSINYVAIYFLFLTNTVLPYFFFSYKTSVLYADQKAYIVSKVDMLINAGTIVVQFLVLLLLKNYYLYLLASICSANLKNYLLSRIANMHYPIIEDVTIHELTSDEKKTLVKNVFSLSLTKISGVVYNSTDNIVISVFVNTITVGLYSNYTMIVNMVKSIIGALFNALTASVGNLNAEGNTENLYSVFKRLNFINFWIYGYLFVCLNSLLNTFVGFWVGQYAIFDKRIVYLIALIFLIPGLNNVINIYKDACGLYWQTKYRALATAVVNLVVSVILVKRIGIAGVFLGTIIAYLTTIYVKDPVVVFRECFHTSVAPYYGELVLRTVLLLVLSQFCDWIMGLLARYMGGFILFVVGGIVLTVVINGIFCALSWKKEEFQYFYGVARKTLKR